MMRHGWAAACALALLALLSGPALAQGAPIRVTGGEHADFTRIVLQSSAPIDWVIEPDERAPLVQISPATAPLDLSQAFARIPRDRLARIDRVDGGLRLGLACDCPIRAFEDRPGVVVLDILDPPAFDEPPSDEPTISAASDEADPAGTPPPTVADTGAPAAQDGAPGFVPPTPGEIAERAGRALAQGAPATGPDAALRLPAASPGGLPDPRASGEPHLAARLAEADRHALRSALTEALFDAIGAGLLTGADYLRAAIEPAGSPLPPPGAPPDGPAEHLQATAPTSLQSQLQIRPPETRAAGPGLTLTPERTSAATRSDDPRCRNLDALDFLAEPATGDFNSRQAALIGRLYGEFDRPDPAIRSDLIRLYLRFGLGAEARQLIDNARHPIAGSDLLRGLADILEDRPSNARLTLARRQGCPGIAGLLAALAGPPPPDLSAHGDDIALSFGLLPAPLRRLFGPPLIERLLDAGALDPARVIAGKLQLTGPAGVDVPALPAALMMGARGAPREGAERIAAQPAPTDIGAMLVRLRLLHEADVQADGALLDEAEALATGARHDAQGIALMVAAIRHDIARAAHAAGFQRLDRLRRWLRKYEGDRQLLAGLADDLWRDAARRADEEALLSLILARDGWRAGERTTPTRSALAARLLDLGLADAAIGLIDPPADSDQRLLLGRAMLARDRPEDAIALLAPLLTDRSDEARAQAGLLTARALRAAGASDAALDAFASLGARDEAARTAIARQDWLALADLTREGAASPPADTATAPLPHRVAPAAIAQAPAASEGIASADDRSSETPPDMLRRLAEAFGSDPASIMGIAASASHAGDAETPIETGNLGAGQPSGAARRVMDDPASPPRATDTRRGAEDGQDAPNDASAGREALLAGQPIAPIAPDLTELPPMLRRNAALIEQSSALRETIDALLHAAAP